MKTILEDPAVTIAGALATSHSKDGITPRRLPKWASDQILDPTLQLMLTNASGVRLVFDTDSDAIELEYLLTGLEFPGSRLPPPCFDLVVDGELNATAQAAVGNRLVVEVLPDRSYNTTLVRGRPSTVAFKNLGRTMKRVEIWLPQGQNVEMRSLKVARGASVRGSDNGAPRWIHHGSSISHCSEADRPTNTWPAVAARAARVDLLNLGFGGQCHLDQFVARTIRDEPADCISAKIGINIVNGDTYRERSFWSALNGFIDTIRDGHPDTPLLIITPILFPAGEDHPGPTVVGRDGLVGVIERPPELAPGALSIGRIRELTQEVVARRQRDDVNLHLIDGRDLFGADDVADLPDGLHPNTAGYIRMGQRFAASAFGANGAFASAARAAAPR